MKGAESDLRLAAEVHVVEQRDHFAGLDRPTDLDRLRNLADDRRDLGWDVGAVPGLGDAEAHPGACHGGRSDPHDLDLPVDVGGYRGGRHATGRGQPQEDHGRSTEEDADHADPEDQREGTTCTGRFGHGAGPGMRMRESGVTNAGSRLGSDQTVYPA